MSSTLNKIEKSSNPNPFELSWRRYYLNIASCVSEKSKDTSPVGAVITIDNMLVSAGFNGLARGMPDECFKDHDRVKKLERLPWICHAELNAITNAARIGIPIQGGTIYTTKFPCLNCLNSIIQSGITTICTDDKSYWENDPEDSSSSQQQANEKTRSTIIYLMNNGRLKIDAPNHNDFNGESILRSIVSPPDAKKVEDAS